MMPLVGAEHQWIEIGALCPDVHDTSSRASWRNLSGQDANSVSGIVADYATRVIACAKDRGFASATDYAHASARTSR